MVHPALPALLGGAEKAPLRANEELAGHVVPLVGTLRLAM